MQDCISWMQQRSRRFEGLLSMFWGGTKTQSVNLLHCWLSILGCFVLFLLCTPTLLLKTSVLCFHTLCQMGGWHSQTVYTELLYPLQVDSKYDEPTCDEGSPRKRGYFAIMWSPSLSHLLGTHHMWNLEVFSAVRGRMKTCCPTNSKWSSGLGCILFSLFWCEIFWCYFHWEGDMHGWGEGKGAQKLRIRTTIWDDW
jgi:hypothetical protein